MIIQNIKDVFTGEFFHRNDYKKRPPYIVEPPPPKPPSVWQGIIDIPTHKKRYWLKNSEKERAENTKVFEQCLAHELGNIGVAVVWKAFEEIKDSEKNPRGTFCVYRSLLKKLIQYGDACIKLGDKNHPVTDPASYKKLQGYDLLRVIIHEPWEQIDYDVITMGVSKVWKRQYMEPRDVFFFSEAVALCERHKKKSLYNQIVWPPLPEIVIEMDVLKQNDIDEKFAEIDNKGIDGIIRYAEDIDTSDIDAFVKAYGIKHLLSYSDGSNVGIVVLKQNGQPWKNFLGLRSADIKVFQKVEEGEES